jgi:hypothetical protein
MNKLLHTILYADDTNIIVTATNYNELQNKVSLSLQHISKWFQTNQLVLNKNKIFVINFSLAKTPTQPLNIRLDNQTLSSTDSLKFLGMHLDSNLSWKPHLEQLLKKLSTVHYMIRNLYYYLTSGSLKTVYFAHFQALLQYRIIFCGSTTSLQKALTMQKRVIRVTLGLGQRTSCRQKFKELQILTVTNLCILKMMMFVIKTPDKYQTNDKIHTKNTRQRNQLCLQSLRLSSVQKGVYHSSIRTFNKPPAHIAQLCGNIIAFKNTLKKFLIKNSFYSINEFMSDNN